MNQNIYFTWNQSQKDKKNIKKTIEKLTCQNWATKTKAKKTQQIEWIMNDIRLYGTMQMLGIWTSAIGKKANTFCFLCISFYFSFRIFGILFVPARRGQHNNQTIETLKLRNSSDSSIFFFMKFIMRIFVYICFRSIISLWK